MSEQVVGFGVGGAGLRRRREEKVKQARGFPTELLETNGEEDIVPWLVSGGHRRTWWLAVAT